ncbi:MAG: hypothetical protein ACR2O4_10575 [Hyphomicrobiaceae bacterium]
MQFSFELCGRSMEHGGPARGTVTVLRQVLKKWSQLAANDRPKWYGVSGDSGHMTSRIGVLGASSALNGAVILGIAAIMLSGCTLGAPKLATCLDDSAACIAERKSTLNSLVADKSRSWVMQRPSPAVYATGVRLFAYRRTMGTLTCPELAAGIAETGGARKTLASGVNGASKTRLGQIVSLSDDVNTELKRASHGKRCPKA